MSITTRGIIIGVLIVVLAGIIVFFGTRRAPLVDAPRESVRIALSVHQITGLVSIAQDQGYFEDEGIDLIVETFTSGAQGFASLRKGASDLATAAETPLAFGAFEKDDFRIIAALGSTDKEVKIVARRDRGIQTPADLRGKRLATHQKGSSPHFFLHLFLTANGMSDDDVSISFNKPEDVAPQVVSGEVDAISMSEPQAGIAERGLGANAIVFPAPGLYNRTYNLIASKEFVEKKPEAVERVLRALVRAEEFAKNDPPQAMSIVSRMLDIPESEVQSVWPDLELRVTLDQSLLTALDDQARWALDSKFVTASSIPNFLSILYVQGLGAVKPSAVTVIR